MNEASGDAKKKLYEPHNYRAEAESKLGQDFVAASVDIITTEKILHELQVHQIELEMQNEELRRAYLEIETSRNSYLDLFEFAPISYFTLSENGLIVEVNVAGAELLGIDRKKLLSCPFSKFVAQKYCDQFHLQLTRLVNQDEQQSYDMQINRGDSSLLYVHVDAKKVLVEGNTVSFRITLTNITENKLLEESLRAANEYLDSLIEYANGPIVVWDASYKIIKVNLALSKLTGLGASELLGMHIEGLFCDDNSENVQAMIQHTMIGERWEGVELPIKSLENALHVISWNTSTLYQNVGKGLWVVIAQGQDVTERKRAEQDLRIAAIAFQVQEGIIVTDVNSNIVRVNNAFATMTGHSIDALVGKPASIIKSGLHDNQFFSGMFEAISRNGFWKGEIWNKRKNGELFPGLMTITPVTNVADNSINYVGTLLDISLQKQAERVLMDDRNALEKQVKKVAKELTSIKGESDEINVALKVMMKMRHSDNETKQLRLIDTLEANLQRLISSYGNINSNSLLRKNLTPKEIQVASMVREGFSSKSIAASLSVSPETINIHRKNIRKKLGLDSRIYNLRSFLISNKINT